MDRLSHHLTVVTRGLVNDHRTPEINPNSELLTVD